MRPISLLSCLGKFMERLVADLVARLANELGALDPNQFGFRSDTNTSHALLNLTNDIFTHTRSNIQAAFSGPVCCL